MCGIAGFVCAAARPFEEAVIRDALDALRPRGPEGTSWLGIDEDGAAHWTREDECQPGRRLAAAVGCSRLAINDVTLAGLQPIVSSDGAVWAALNGEVFNFVELRAELAERGFRFYTGTDTEVVANAYSAWGEACFERFNGQFAIAILDPGNRRLVLARDRVGIVPLFLRRAEGRLVFGSEIKAILRAPLLHPGPDPQQVAARIGLPYKLNGGPGATLYRGVRAVRPGEYLVFGLADLREAAAFYWRADSFERRATGSFVEAKERLRDLLVDSVRLRLRTDRKLAFILSGGVDSPSVLGIARKRFGIDPVTFSLDLPDGRFNENPAIREVLAWLGLPEGFIPVTARKVADALPAIVTYADEPLATPNAVLHGILAHAIDDTGTKVVLNGVGGDEVFCGYHDHFLYHLRQLRLDGDPRFLSEATAWQRRQNRGAELFEAFCRFADDSGPQYSPDFLARSAGFDYRVLLRADAGAGLDETVLAASRDNTPAGKQIRDLTSLTVPHAVRMDDNCYLARAVEARQPFLDHRLIEFGLSLPPLHKIRRGVSKFILRQAMRGFVPDSRRNDARKIGLNLPIDSWMRGPLKGWVTDSLEGRNAPVYAFAEFGAVQDVLGQHFNGSVNHSLKIWDLCCMNDWLGRISQPASASRPLGQEVA